MKASDLSKMAQYVNMTEVARKISNDVKEYLIIAEQEQTKRSAIEASYGIEIEKIEAIRSTLEHFLDRSFEERRRNFEDLFSVVRSSMEKGDLKSLELSLSAVVEMAKVSPLAEAKSLASLKSAMDDPDHEFTI